MANPYAVAISVLLNLTLLGAGPAAALQITPMKVDPVHVHTWNRFVDALYELHTEHLKSYEVRSTETIGGYSRHPDFYREVTYFDAETGRVLSQIQWERAHPERIHAIEVYIYDDAGRVLRDYYARYYPDYRNAPIQTLINLHSHNGDLHAYRQFDASGYRIYEQCAGSLAGEDVFLSLEDAELPPLVNASAATLPSRTYRACFQGVPRSALPFLDPLAELSGNHPRRWPDLGEAIDNADDVAGLIDDLSQQIQETPQRGMLYVRRGQAFFVRNEFDRAVDDFSKAIEIDDQLDAAYFGRGMALARRGDIEAGIADLGIFIERHPEDSLAYTKRGVRYIWNGDLDKAEQDLLRAIELDARNAEAHDDLGVIYAQRRDYRRAIDQFYSAIDCDPTYQKAFHNLAMTYYLAGDNSASLFAVNHSLRLDADDRNSLLLKSQVLQALGEADAARTLRNEAESLPEGNQSERFPID